MGKSQDSSCLRARDAFAAADSFYHIVQLCTIFKRWPTWGDAVLLQWLTNQTPRIAFAEVQVPSQEFEFLTKHAAGKQNVLSLSL
jgi:hypothetical protein